MLATSGTEAPAEMALRIVLDAMLFLLASALLLSFDAMLAPAGAFDFLAPALMFAAITVTSNAVFGINQRADSVALLDGVARVILGLISALPAAYLAFAAIPHSNTEWLVPRAVAAAPVIVLLRQLALWGIQARAASRRVMVLGLGRIAAEIGAAIAEADAGAIELVGYYSCGRQGDVAVPPQLILDLDSSFEAVILRERIDEVVVAVQDQRGGALPLNDLLNCKLHGVHVTDHSQFLERMRGEVPIESLKASYLIFGDGFRQKGGRALRKRVFDILVSLVLSFLTAPIMLMTAIVIRLESQGPVIYRQGRVGRDGKVFELLKFRSMRVDAEEAGKPQWARAGDARITRVGRFLRKTRIDELPQILNVLRGEMSFVGPRPERPFFVEQLTQEVPFYAARHSVKPGITGWAQVRFTYGASVSDGARKLRYDLYYVKNHSFLLDIAILVRTVRVVLLGVGAR